MQQTAKDSAFEKQVEQLRGQIVAKEAEFQRQLAARAMQTIQAEFEDKTWQAFWQTAVDGLSAADVSRRIGLSAGAIYVAKSRVLARLKEEVERLQAEEE